MRGIRIVKPWHFLCAAMGAACDGGAALPQDGGDDAALVAMSTGEAGAPSEVDGSAYGQVFRGGEYNLGPVDYDETDFHNACASDQKYVPLVRQAEGPLLAGVWSGLSTTPQSYCDTCIRVDTAQGKSAVLRVVTHGDTNVNSLDVSPQAYAQLNVGEFPRDMTWQQVACPASGPLVYEFKTGSNAYWTAFWVRNARVPIASVETSSVRHAFAATSQDADGSRVDANGVGDDMFSVRVTSVDGLQIVDTFARPTKGLPGAVLVGRTNF